MNIHLIIVRINVNNQFKRFIKVMDGKNGTSN
jgi:hypothetical protein